MKNVRRIILSLAMIMFAVSANAGRLWIIGDATPYGWDLDNATALLSSPEKETVYTGTIHLKAGMEFKFATAPEFGSEEFGGALDATMVDGKINLATGSNDSGYAKLKVENDGNYFITVDTQNLVATFVLSAYQDAELRHCSLFMVGDATENGWDIMKGTPLYQDSEEPYIYRAENLSLKVGEFKIATSLRGACTWDPKYWYFRDANDSGKIALAQEGDLKWNISEEKQYNVTVNTKDLTIVIGLPAPSGIESIEVEESEQKAEYYNLMGVRVMNPQPGLYICKTGSKCEKVFVTEFR